jgi:CHAD domain-containing protein
VKKKSALSGKRLNLRTSGREILPPLLDSFLERINPVILNERHQEPLHALRLRGKRVRYAMEMYLPAYGSSFAECLESVKQILVMLGRIHDIDINLPVLRQYVRQVRHFNAGISDRALKIPAAGLRALILRFEHERHELFLSLYKQFSQWEEEQFRRRFIKSILERGD